MGVVAGYLLWSDRLADRPQAIAAGRARGRAPDGPAGRELVAALASSLRPTPHGGSARAA